jgi:hypothetical protein
MMNSQTFRTLMSGCELIQATCDEALEAFECSDLEEVAHCLLMAEKDCETLLQQLIRARLESHAIVESSAS